MITFHQFLESQEDDRPTRHRVFEPYAIFAPKENDFIADNPNYAYRITGQPQIDDILQSGLVRAKLGKIKGGRSGETQWSQGGSNPENNYPAKYSPNKDSYILVANTKDLHDRQGGLPKEELIQVLKSDGTKWIDITNEIKTKPINKP